MINPKDYLIRYFILLLFLVYSVNGYAQKTAFELAYDVTINSRKIRLVPGKSDQQNLERLLSGEIDYMLVDDLLIQYLLKYQVNDVQEFLEIADYPILVKPLYFALRKDVEGAEDIITAFNAEIKKMMAEGNYNRILELNW